MIYMSLDLRFGCSANHLISSSCLHLDESFSKGIKWWFQIGLITLKGMKENLGPKTLLLIGVFPVQCLIIWTHITFLNCLLGRYGRFLLGLGFFFLKSLKQRFKAIFQIGLCVFLSAMQFELWMLHLYTKFSTSLTIFCQLCSLKVQ
jgi:hypothetical protein